MHITARQDAIIIGSLLGDGCLEQNGKWTRLRLEHGHIQKSYLVWKYQELKSLVTGKVMTVRYFNKTRKLPYESFRMYTFSDPALDLYRNKFYLNKKKIIPKNFASLLKDPLSLAIWFMTMDTKEMIAMHFDSALIHLQRMNSTYFNLFSKAILG